MHTEFKPEDPDVLREMGYDNRDLKIPLVKKYTIAITASCIACFAISVPLYNYLTTPGGAITSMLGRDRQPAPASKNRIQPPNPLLQDNFTTKMDIKDLRRHEDEVMSSYGWVDQNNGVVHEPIEKAMQTVIERGVSTGEQVPAVSKGNTIIQNAVGPGTSQQR